MRRRLWAALLALALTAVLVAAAGGPERARADTASPCAGICEPPQEVEPVDPQHSVLVLNVGWNTGQPQSSAKLDPTALPRFAGFARGGLNQFLRDSAAPLPFHDWQVSEGGSYSILAPPEAIVHPKVCTSALLTIQVSNAARAAAAAHGIDASDYAVVVTHYQLGTCTAGGFTVGNDVALISGGKAMNHEFGHVYGLNHANSVQCTGAAGTPVPLSANCAEVEYGDPYDTMGIGTGSFGAVYANQLGWLQGQFYDVVAGDFAFSYTLKPFTDPSHTQRALRLRDGATTLWLEYRQPTGVDGPLYNGGLEFRQVTPGLIIHREALLPGATEPTSQLLDMTPATGTAEAGLPLGQTWANPLGEMKVTLNSASSTSAKVTISSQRRSVPDLVDLTRSAAIAAIEAAGLAYGGLTSKTDASCNYIKKVMAQTPLAGTRVLPGAQVAITEGTEDRSVPCK